MTAFASTLSVSDFDSTPAPSLEDPLAPWVERVRQGDAGAFETLYRRTRSDAAAVLFRLVGPSSDLDDLIQEVYLQLIRAVRGFRGQARFSTFLYRVCANVALMHGRKKRRRPEDATDTLPEQTAGEASDPERALHIKQAHDSVQQVLEQMEPNRRVVFVYHELLGMKPEEMSQALKVPVNTVRSRLARARVEFTALLASRPKGAFDAA